MRNSLYFARLVKYIENYNFGEFFNDVNVEDFIDYFYQVSTEYQNGLWRCDYGATKLVIIMDEEDIVFKIPFNSDYDFLEKSCMFFYGAPAPSTWDYCEAEEERYAVAEENGFANLLAKTNIIYTTKNGIRIYTQPKCFTKTHIKPNSKKKYLTFSTWYKRQMPIDNLCWLNTFIDYYGAYRMKKFFDFLIEEEWDDDLCGSNIGYDMNGAPVLIDYSSYMEQNLNFDQFQL